MVFSLLSFGFSCVWNLFSWTPHDFPPPALSGEIPSADVFPPPLASLRRERRRHGFIGTHQFCLFFLSSLTGSFLFPFLSRRRSCAVFLRIPPSPPRSERFFPLVLGLTRPRSPSLVHTDSFCADTLLLLPGCLSTLIMSPLSVRLPLPSFYPHTRF